MHDVAWTDKYLLRQESSILLTVQGPLTNISVKPRTSPFEAAVALRRRRGLRG